MFRFVTLLFLSCQALSFDANAGGNPIRKVVTLLQDMQKEIAAEGDAEKKLFDKFMCYCDGNTDGMSKAAGEAAQRITALQSQLEAEKAEKSQLDQELMQHKMDRESANKDLQTATSIRNKEHEDYVGATGEQKENIDALTGAIAALEKGAGKSFLQASKAAVDRVSKSVKIAQSIDDYAKNKVISFLEGQNNQFGDYSSQSGEIVGILKSMNDEMDSDLNGAISAEAVAAKGFEELAAAKKAEIAANGEAIESKTKRSGSLAVSIVTTDDDIADTTADLSETQAFLANLASQCATKKTEWDSRTQTRAQEIAAISEAIKILNDDDALDLFKKTLALEQGPRSFGFLQKQSSASAASRAHDLIAAAAGKSSEHSTQLGLIMYGLTAKAVDFSKVLAMVDNMVSVLSQEQKDDDSQKSFCEKDMDKSEQESKDTSEAIASSAALIEETAAASANTAEEIAGCQKEIKALDKAVGDATEQRKNEHGEFLTFQTQNNAALQLIEKAKNRLFKFYRPNSHVEAPKRALTDEEKILASSGRSDLIATDAPEMIDGTSQAVYVQIRTASNAAPPPPPETWDAYESKGGKSNGIISLMEMLHKELQGDLTEAENDEVTSQKDYERLMAESQAARAQNVESITSKEAAKADLDMKVESTKQANASQEAQLSNIKDYLAQLHSSCDFLLQNFDLRKAARANEVESLKNAKSVLSGANFA